MTPLEIFAILLAAGLAIALWFSTRQRNLDASHHQLEMANAAFALEEQSKLAVKERKRLLNALTDAFLLIDETGQIIFANKAANRLFHSRSLINRSLREAFTDPRLAQAMTEGLLASKPIRTRITLPQQASPLGDDERRGMNSWLVDVAILPGDEGAAPMTRAIIRDITAEQQTDQIRKDFVANASHELRTPMAIIHGYLENLLEDDMLEDTEMSRRFLAIMRKHSGRITRIIEDMLVISRLESGEESSLNIEPFKLQDCLNDILERLESLIHSQKASVELKLSDEKVQIHGDRFYWTQALFNLIENALKQNSRPGLKIEIGCLVKDDELQIWVSDDGIGIPSAALPHVFRRFYRVDKQHSQNEIKGTGLGLSIVKRAIEAHQGRIVASSTPGSETKFLMTVPLAGPKPDSVELDSQIPLFKE